MSDAILEIMKQDKQEREAAYKWAGKIEEILGNNIKGGITYTVLVERDFDSFVVIMRLFYGEYNLSRSIGVLMLERMENQSGYIRYLLERFVFDLAKLIFLKDANP